MAIYYIICIILIVVGLMTHPSKTPKRRSLFLGFAFLLLVMVSGLRAASVGVDTGTYLLLFHNSDAIGIISTRFEIGYLILLKVLHSISASDTFFLLITSCICIGLPILVVYKHSEDPLLSVLLYILLKDYFFQMNTIRQSIASVIVMMALSLLLSDKTRKRKLFSLVLIIMAGLIHRIGFIAVVPYFLLMSSNRIEKYIKPETCIRYTIISSLIAFFSFSLFQKIAAFVFPQYIMYFYSEWGESNYFASLISMVMYLAFLIVGSNYLKKKKEITDTDRLALMMTMFCVITWTLAMRMEIWSRLAGLFSIYVPLLFIPCFTNCPLIYSNRKVLKVSIVILCALYMTITLVFRPEWEGVVPYKFMFQ